MPKPIKNEAGFTLIELLIVILVIGILATIALPSFLGQQKKGQDGEAKSNARNLVTQVESCFASTQDFRQCDEPADLGGTGLNQIAASSYPNAGDVGVTNSTQDSYMIQTQSKSGMFFAITKSAATGATSRSCGETSQSDTLVNGTTGGGCKADNTW